jgi:hypothetical protein
MQALLRSNWGKLPMIMDYDDAMTDHGCDAMTDLCTSVCVRQNSRHQTSACEHTTFTQLDSNSSPQSNRRNSHGDDVQRIQGWGQHQQHHQVIITTVTSHRCYNACCNSQAYSHGPWQASAAQRDDVKRTEVG